MFFMVIFFIKLGMYSGLNVSVISSYTCIII